MTNGIKDGFSGGCLCGAVRYQSSAPAQLAVHCYCTDCRKSSGTTHGTHVAAMQDTASVTGELQSFDKPTDSGNVVTRAFCPSCGSAIYSLNSAMPGMVFFRASSLDDPDVIEPSMTVYASRAAKWAMIDKTKPVFEEMPEGGPEAAIDR